MKKQNNLFNGCFRKVQVKKLQYRFDKKFIELQTEVVEGEDKGVIITNLFKLDENVEKYHNQELNQILPEKHVPFWVQIVGDGENAKIAWRVSDAEIKQLMAPTF